MKGLKSLDISGNTILEIPDAIQNLTKLEVLICDGNPIPQLPQALFKLKGLKTLSMK